MFFTSALAQGSTTQKPYALEGFVVTNQGSASNKHASRVTDDLHPIAVKELFPTWKMERDAPGWVFKREEKSIFHAPTNNPLQPCRP